LKKLILGVEKAVANAQKLGKLIIEVREEFLSVQFEI
jgi:hypothetical protein